LTKRIAVEPGDGGSAAVVVPRPLPPRHCSGNTIITRRTSLAVTATLTDV